MKRKLIFSGFIGILFVILIVVVQATQKENIHSAAFAEGQQNTSTNQKGAQFSLISPIVAEENASLVLLGKVISNEAANIYTRRGGIVKDIFVDVGDNVEEGQVVALLLPQGVEGQSEANIALETAKVQQARNNLHNAENISATTTQLARQKLEDKRIALQNAEENRNATISQKETLLSTTTDNESAKFSAAKQQIKVVEASIALIKSQIETSENDQQRRFEQAENNIKQKLEQAEVAVLHAQETVEQIFATASSSSNNDRYEYVQQHELPYILGFREESTRGNISNSYNALFRERTAFTELSEEEKASQIRKLTGVANTLLLDASALLQATIETNNLSSETITMLSNTVHASQTTLLKAQEDIEDALNAYEVLKSSEEEMLTTLQNKLLQQQEMLIAAEENVEIISSAQAKGTKGAEEELEVTLTMEDSKIRALESQIAVMEKELAQIEAEQQQKVEYQQNLLRIASSSLHKEQAVSGHQEIRSPFSGVVSKRFLQVGETTMPIMPAFELTEVKTTLSQKAKREIQFALPEERRDEVQVGDSLEFFVVGKETEVFSAEVTRISPQVDGETHTITIQAKIDDNLKLPHHTSVRIRISSAEAQVFRVPSAAIDREEGENFLWILDQESQKPQKVMVNVLAEDGEYAEVNGEISEETKVISDPMSQFLDDSE